VIRVSCSCCFRYHLKKSLLFFFSVGCYLDIESKIFVGCPLTKNKTDAPDDDDDDDGDGDDAEWKCEPAASPCERISTLKRKTRRVVVQHEQ